MRACYLSLGSNVGNRQQHLTSGLAIVCGTDARRVSRVYETEPVGGVAQDNFWNLVVEVTTDATAHQLLARAHEAEATNGRTRDVRWGPRTLDVDVLLVGDETSEDPEVLVPHPRLYERAFVLNPLRELAPELVSDEQLRASVGRVVALGTLESLR